MFAVRPLRHVTSRNPLNRISDEIALGNAMAFFLAGSATVRVTVECLIHLMAKHPEIQRRVQAEIDELTGGSREVTWADSKELVYTSAVIAERYRYLTPAPAGTPRRYDPSWTGCASLPVSHSTRERLSSDRFSLPEC